MSTRTSIFCKDSKEPEPVPEKGVERAVELMRSGHLYRYNFSSDFDETDAPAESELEPACETSLLEREFAMYTGHRFAVAVNSCGSALFLSLKAAGLSPGEKVLTNAFTFTAVPSSIVHAAGVPVYIECDEQLVLDLGDLRRKIDAHPDARFLMLSHMRGHIANLPIIKQLCLEFDICLIEDCAHSLGARWGESLVGTFGEIACFSSQSYKMLNSGEGGFLATSDERLAAYSILAAGCYEKLYRKHLSRPADHLFEELKTSVPNFSLRMSNLTAAVIRPQLETLEERVGLYNTLYRQLKSLLRHPNIVIPEPLPSVRRVGDSLQFLLKGLTENQLESFLRGTAERNVKIQIFGRMDNARYFRNWRYSYDTAPALNQTEEILAVACDLRISLSYAPEDVRILAQIILETLGAL